MYNLTLRPQEKMVRETGLETPRRSWDPWTLPEPKGDLVVQAEKAQSKSI